MTHQPSDPPLPLTERAPAPSPAAAEPSAPPSGPETLDAEGLKDELTARGRSAACLLGPQDVGKSMFMQFLTHHYHSQAPARWSLTPWFRAAAPELAPHEIKVRATIPTGLPGQAPIKAELGGAEYLREAGTKDIILFQALSETSTRRRLAIDFLDIPGEWVTWKKEQTHQEPGEDSGILARLRKAPLEPIEVVLDHAEAVVLFFPFWGLFAPEVHAEMPPEILAMTSLQRAHTAEDVQEKARYMTRNFDDWAERLEHQLQRAAKGKRAPVHLLVVLNQFQREVVIAYLERLSHEPGWPAGWTPEGLWSRWEALLNPPPPTRTSPEAALSRLLESAWATTQWMLWCVQTIGMSRLGNRKAFDLLADLLPMQGVRPETEHSLAQKRALGRVHVMPLNLFEDSEGVGSTGPLRMDHRMAHDVIWWLIMQLRGEELWPA